ncbi:hypothetical protein BDD12DRAFT_980102 [Trichophaea hybrida]|nr:hypothetical protein BDD12DRAFT_980102 [Trichophaea hybrida]
MVIMDPPPNHCPLPNAKPRPLPPPPPTTAIKAWKCHSIPKRTRRYHQIFAHHFPKKASHFPKEALSSSHLPLVSRCPLDPAEWIKADEDPYAYMALQIDTTPPNETRFLLCRKNGETLTTEQRGHLQITNQRSMRNHSDDGKMENCTGIQGLVQFGYSNSWYYTVQYSFALNPVPNCVSGVEMNEEDLKHHYSSVHKLQVEAFIDIEKEFNQEGE